MLKSIFSRISSTQIKFISLLVVALFLYVLVLLGAEVTIGTTIKSETQEVLGVSNTPDELKLQSNQLSDTYTSPVFKADFEFNAIAPHWEENLAEGEHRHIEVRVAKNRRNWTDWMELEVVGGLRDDDPSLGRAFPEAPLFIEGRYFQYRITLSRQFLTQASPRVRDLHINYIDSRKSLPQRIASMFKDITPEVSANESGDLDIISRADWGSPDPYGEKFHGTYRYWRPTYNPTEQIFLHHTVTKNTQSDPEAVMRAIWDYHTNTLGWGDIGYNYVLDHQGNIYEGRFGGDNVTAGHVFNYNRGSLGVAVLGCFQPNSSVCNQLNGGNVTPPTDATINNLVDLLSFKTTGFEIDPEATHAFCDFKGDNCKSIPTIAAHRDAHGHDDTTCNGQLFYDLLPSIRTNTASKNNESPWVYSAKQESYEQVILVDEEVDVTLQFKNTGSQTWSNETNKMLLKTTNPDGRSSKFKGSDWLDDTTVAALNEPSVLPEEIGSFTFKIKRPDGVVGNFFEGLGLITENGNNVNSIFALDIIATIPHPNGTLIRQSGQARVYLVEGSQRRRIVSREVFDSHGFKLSQVRTATVASMNLAEDSILGFREGTLLQGSSSRVYVVNYDNGQIQKRHITSRSVFDVLGLSFDDVVKVDDSQLPSQNGPALDSADVHPDGMLVRAPGSPRVYWLENAQRQRIVSRAVFDSHAFDFDLVKVATNNSLDLPQASTLGFREGTLLQGSNDPVYVVNYNNGQIQKRHIASRSVFDALGLSFSDVMKVQDSQLPSQNGETIK